MIQDKISNGSGFRLYLALAIGLSVNACKQGGDGRLSATKDVSYCSVESINNVGPRTTALTLGLKCSDNNAHIAIIQSAVREYKIGEKLTCVVSAHSPQSDIWSCDNDRFSFISELSPKFSSTPTPAPTPNKTSR